MYINYLYLSRPLAKVFFYAALAAVLGGEVPDNARGGNVA